MEVQSQSVVDGGNSGGFKRGTKRDASDSNLSDFERFEKRLRMLSLRSSEQNGKLYTPRPNEPSPPPSPPRRGNGVLHANHVSSDDVMHVDDTRDRVYVHDLDAELEDTEPEEERLIFLPDIERHFSKLPAHVLNGRREDENDNQELVLYSVPKSLTVDEGHDSVRQAIIESRQRAREKAVEEARREEMSRTYDHGSFVNSMETAHGYNAGYTSIYESPELDGDLDAMDIG